MTQPLTPASFTMAKPLGPTELRIALNAEFERLVSETIQRINNHLTADARCQGLGVWSELEIPLAQDCSQALRGRIIVEYTMAGWDIQPVSRRVSGNVSEVLVFTPGGKS